MYKKKIIFDLDDTLISEEEYINSGFDTISLYISNKYNLDKNIIKIKIKELYKESSKNVFNRLLDILKIKNSTEELKCLIKLYRNHYPNIKLYKDAQEIIEYLYEKKYLMGIITDGYKETQKKKIESLNLRKYIKEIIITDELSNNREYWKPSEIPYNMIKKKFNCNYEDIIYVGDNIEKDFVTANKLGIITICIKRDNGIYRDKVKDKKYLAKINISNLNEIKNIL